MPALLREHNWLPAHGRLFDGEMVVYGDSRGTLRYFACDICGSVIASSCSPAGGSPGS